MVYAADKVDSVHQQSELTCALAIESTCFCQNALNWLQQTPIVTMQHVGDKSTRTTSHYSFHLGTLSISSSIEPNRSQSPKSSLDPAG